MFTYDIQWGRARAIQGAYCRKIEQMSPGEDVISLNVGDVYSWLSENGHLPGMNNAGPKTMRILSN